MTTSEMVPQTILEEEDREVEDVGTVKFIVERYSYFPESKFNDKPTYEVKALLSNGPDPKFDGQVTYRNLYHALVATRSMGGFQYRVNVTGTEMDVAVAKISHEVVGKAIALAERLNTGEIV